MNLKDYVSTSIRSLLLEKKYQKTLLEKSDLKNVWMKKFKDVVNDKNPEVVNQKDFWNAAEILYSKGLPATSAAEFMFNREPQGSPTPKDFPQGTGGWGHK